MSTTARRSVAVTIAVGLAALAGLLLVMIGIPAALAYFGGNPLPAHLPAPAQVLHALTRPDDGTLFLHGLALVGWAAWASFAISLLVQIPAQIRGIPAPRLPGLSWQQGRSAAMVAAVGAMLALISIGGIAHPSPAAAAPPSGRAVATQTTPARPAAPAHITATPRATHDTVTVRPGDTLWGLAEHAYGDGSRYPQIAAATRDVTQPGGAHLTDPDLILPGWHITIPHTTGAASTPAPAPTGPAPTIQSAPDHRGGSTSTSPSGGAAADHSTAHQTGSVEQATPATPHAPPAAPLTQPATQAAPAAASMAAAETTQTSYVPALATTAGLGSLAAAGLLGALRVRRARQARRRQPGRRIALPQGEAAIAEAQLRVAADPLAASDLDQALRTLAAHAHGLGVPMPGLRAARITRDALELYLVDPDIALPTPFTTDPDAPGTWTLERSGLEVLLDEDEAALVPAPYPALVTIGHDEDQAHLLLNLEELGALTITGDQHLAGEVLTALAIELITSTWTDDSRVTLVGILPELVHALGSDRATYVDTLEQILNGIEYTAGVHREALTTAGQDGPAQARAAGVVDDAWTPHLILAGTALTASERDRATQVLASVPRVAVAAVTTGTEPLGEWTLTVSMADGNAQADLAPTPVRVTPQRLPEAAYRSILATMAVTDEDDVDGPDWTEGIADGDALSLADLPQPEPAAAVDEVHPGALVDETRPEGVAVEPSDSASSELETTIGDADLEEDRFVDEETITAEHVAQVSKLPAARPLVRLLGPVQILGALGPQPESVHRSTEVIAYLALHPGRSAQAFSEAIFPGEGIYTSQSRRSTTKRTGKDGAKAGSKGSPLGSKRNTYLRNARRWLGDSDDGHPYVGLVPEIGYTLAADTPVDWWVFQELVGSAIGATSTANLKSALELVDGQPLSGVDELRYKWAMSDKTEILDAVADVAHELARRATIAGDARTASWAAAKGLECNPVNEALWRDAITAAWQSGVPGAARNLIARCHAELDELGGDLSEDTIQLINDVIHGERQAAHA